MDFKSSEHRNLYKSLKDKIVFTYNAQDNMYKNRIRKPEVINALCLEEKYSISNGNLVCESANIRILYSEKNNKLVVIGVKRRRE